MTKQLHKGLFYCGYMLLLAMGSTAQQIDIDWVKTYGGLTNDERPFAMEVDHLGNTYVLGEFEGTVDFDPGNGVSNLTSNGGTDVYLLKLDAQGDFVWVKSFGGRLDDQGRSIIINDIGLLFIAGTFKDTVDFNPGAGVNQRVSNGGDDIFIMCFNSLNGGVFWTKTIGQLLDDDVSSLALDDQSSLYATGDYSMQTDFNPGSAVFNLTPAGNADVFVLKLNVSGNFVWAKSFGGTNFERGDAIALDDNGNIYITGYFQGTADFDPGGGVFNISTVSLRDMFVVKLRNNGSFLWAKSIGGFWLFTSDLVLDSKKNVIVTGSFRGNVDFDPGPNTAQLSSQGGGHDVFIVKLDSLGNYHWAKSFGKPNTSDHGYQMHIDRYDNIYTLGEYQGQADLDPGPGVLSFSITSGSGTFIQKLDNAGILQWVKGLQVQSSSVDGVDFELLPSGDILTVGSYYRNFTLFPNNVLVGVPSNTQRNQYLLRLKCVPLIQRDTVVTCESYTWINGQTYTSSDSSARIVYSSQQACDSIVQLQLTILKASESVDSLQACDSLTWRNGITYFASNQSATDTLINHAGCDSIVRLNLVIANSQSVDTLEACDSLLWIDGNTYFASNDSATYVTTNQFGCDSTIRLHLTIHQPKISTDSLVACDSLLWIDGNTYYASNQSATHLLTTTEGCDSLVQLNLQLYASKTRVDSIVACEQYQWIDGNTYSSSNSSAVVRYSTTRGCDSLVRLNLTILNATDTTWRVTSCSDYTWSQNNTTYSTSGVYTDTIRNAVGCDSIARLDLTIGRSDTMQTVMACDSFVWTNQITYYASTNLPKDTFVNRFGCDSIVQLNLDILRFEDSISFSQDTLFTHQLGSSYQWYRCDGNYQAIAGANLPFYVPTISANYSCEIITAHCTDTTRCYSVQLTALEQRSVSMNHNVTVFPIPSDGRLWITGIEGRTDIQLFNLEGQLVWSQMVGSQTNVVDLDLSHLLEGVYFMQMRTVDGNSQIHKVILH